VWSSWLNSARPSGCRRILGTASLTSDGLISSQIKLAIKRAFAGLAGAGQTQLEDSLLLKQRNKARTVLWALHTKGHAEILAGKVHGINFEPQDDYRTRVYVWVVKEKEK
jgi:hypothetical protein